MIATIEIPMENDEFVELELDIYFHHEGKYYPASMDGPAEYPELYVDSVYFVATGLEVPEEISEKIWNELEDACEDNGDDREPDDHCDPHAGMDRVQNAYDSRIYDPYPNL